MVRNPKIDATSEAEAAKARLRNAVQQVGVEFQQSTEQLQNKVIETVQEVQDRVSDTTDQLGNQFQQTLHQPIDAIRKRPLETVVASLVAGLIVGVLTHKGQSKTGNHLSATNASTSSLLSGVVAGGLGKMVWDVVREEYLTPQNISQFIKSTVRPESRKTEASTSPTSSET